MGYTKALVVRGGLIKIDEYNWLAKCDNEVKDITPDIFHAKNMDDLEKYFNVLFKLDEKLERSRTSLGKFLDQIWLASRQTTENH